MANIQNVDYEALPSQAKQMRETGKKLNDEVKKAYESIGSMHKSWYGKRYNELVSEFNKIIPQINQILELVVGDIPFTLETVANNYSQADKGSKVTQAVKDAPSKITALSTPNDVGMKFIAGDVANVQRSVSDNFKNAKEQMNNIDAQYKKIAWKSDASEAFKESFTKLRTSILKSFEDINSSFTKLMNQTQDDIKKTESANTVK